jgi:hypothetical protein
MLVASHRSDPARFWRRGVWLSLLVLLLSLLSLAPYLTSSTEVVRLRHALLLADDNAVRFDWTPAKPAQ